MPSPDYAPLWYWVRERECIRVLKESGARAPWTSDPILALYRFCNVRREDDAVTRWVKKHIGKPFAKHPHLWFMLCAARMINWPPTLRYLIGSQGWPDHAEFTPIYMAGILADVHGRGQKVFTGAYVIPPVPGYSSKTRGVALVTLGKLWEKREVFAETFARKTTMREIHALLCLHDGWGPFLAYQAVVDMRFTKLLDKAPDRASWAAAGPGTIHGLNRLHGRPVDARLSQRQALDEVLAIYEVAQRATGVSMDLSDVPNILCETDKWLRVRNGEGKPRSLYAPGQWC